MPGSYRITLSLYTLLLLLPAAPLPAQEEDELMPDEQPAMEAAPEEEAAPAPAAPPVTTKKIYRSIGPDGSIVFSDVPTDGAEEVDLSQPTVVDAPPPPEFVYTREKEAAPVDRYDMLAITSPGHDEAVRENAGNVSVNVSMNPNLSGGDQVVLLLDGREVAAGTQTTFRLQNVDRGTHQLRALVRGPDGSILKNSEAITFHLLRHSRLHPKPNVGGAPKPPTPGGKAPGGDN
jgi:hypothetical protein